MSWRNRLVVAETSTGTKVIKQYRETSNLDSIAHEHSILSHLESCAFPAVRLDRADDETTIVEVDGALFAVFEYEPGRSLTACFLSTRTRRRLLGEAGATLGRLHSVLDGFVASGRHHLGCDPGTGRRERDLAWHLETLTRLESAESAGGAEQGELGWLRSRADYIADSLSHLDEQLGRVDLPMSIIHGDYGTHNLLFRSDGTAVVHDFELSRYDWRLLDLVITFGRVAPPNQAAFVAGYRTTRPLPSEEFAVLPVLWRFHLLSGAVRSWERFSELGGAERLVTARRRVAAAEAGPDQALAPGS
jgi:Ser/Thr protein kinase RdoA (MazF antagonist)